MANSATKSSFPGSRKQAKSTSILLAKMAQLNTNFGKFHKISKCPNKRWGHFFSFL